MNNLLLFFPIILVVVLFCARILILWYERQQIRNHAEKIYIGSLNYIKGNSDPHDLEILATREAFYEGILIEHKVYKLLLQKLKTLLSTQDVSLLKSFEYLDPKSK